MIVEMMPCIKAASGTLCKSPNGKRVIFTTRKAPTTNPNRMRAYIRSAESYKRKTPPSEKELQSRSLFARRQAFVKKIMASGLCLSKAEVWEIAKRNIR